MAENGWNVERLVSGAVLVAAAVHRRHQSEGGHQGGGGNPATRHQLASSALGP